MEITLRCHVTSPALWLCGSMYTENISRDGVLIAWRGESGPLAPPDVGQIIVVEIELPANHGFGQKCMHCEGAVSRVWTPKGEWPRVALTVNYMDFRSFHDRIRAVESVYPAVSSWMV
ncbi:MAG: hypothetical protein ABSC23_00030 [Bryobacteraceae bacterium]|jgi:hypothetical protein